MPVAGYRADSAIFSVVDGVLLQPFPYPNADRIVVVNSNKQRAGIIRAGMPWPDFRDLRDENTTLSTIAAFAGRTLTIADGTAEPERFNGATVSISFIGHLTAARSPTR